MTIEIKYAFDNPVDYSYDSAKVEVTGGVSRLKLAANPAQVFNEDFADDTGFTYDSSKLLFTGGVLEQKESLANASIAIEYSSGLDCKWSDSGVLAPLSTLNSPTVGADGLDLSTYKNVKYDSSNSYDSKKGAIRFKLTPAYSGTPAETNQWLFFENEGNVGSDRLFLQHDAQGFVRVIGSSGSGSSFPAYTFGSWSPVAGQTYEIELNWDFINGSRRLFIDGVQLGGDGPLFQTMTGLLPSSSLRIGGNLGSSPAFAIKDIILFTEVQHTSGYTPGYTIGIRYGESSAALPSFVYAGEGAVQSFDSLAITGTSSIGFTINGKWWDGGAWSISDGSYAQSSSLATINMHLGSIQVSNSVNVVAIFPASNAKESIDDLTLNYTGQAYFTGSTILPNAAVPASSVSGFIAEETDLAGTSIRYVIEVDTVMVWWDGANWVPSSGVAETNTAQEVNDNAASLALSPSGSFVRPLIYFITDGSGTSELEAVTVAFVYDVNPIQAPSKTVVFGSLRDIIAEPFSSASLRVENAELFFKTGTAILPSKVVGNTNEQAVAYVELVRTGPDGYKYSFYIDYYDAEGSLKTISLGKSVAPDDEATNIATLTFE